MKKIVFCFTLGILILLFTVGVVFATIQNVNTQNETTGYVNYDSAIETQQITQNENLNEVILKGNEVLNALQNESNSPEKLRKVNSNNYKITEIVEDNNYNTESYLYTDNQNYEIQLDTEDLSVVRILSLDINYNISNEDTTKEEALEYVTKVYNSLNLDSSYNLVYLEKFDDTLWEANYQKEYDGIYNPYESVKIIFSPIEQKIASLKVFKLEYDNQQESIISEENAKSIFSDKFSSLDAISDEQVTAELVLTRPNNLLDDNREYGSKALFNNEIKKAWKVTNSDGITAFVDVETGNVIGGDSNE